MSFLGISSPPATGSSQEEASALGSPPLGGSAPLGGMLPGMPPLHPAPTQILNQQGQQEQHDHLQQMLIQQATGALFKQYHNYF